MSTRITWRSIVCRFLIAIAVSFLLGLFLFGMQLAIEEKGVSGVKKFSLFVMLIYASGFSWDTLKHITTLPEAVFLRFRTKVAESVAWFLCYVIAGITFQLLLGPLAGWITIFSVVVLIAAAFAGVKAVLGLGAALEAAMVETPRDDG